MYFSKIIVLFSLIKQSPQRNIPLFAIQIIIITTIKIFKQSFGVQIIQNKHRVTTVNFVQTQFNPTFPPQLPSTFSKSIHGS